MDKDDKKPAAAAPAPVKAPAPVEEKPAPAPAKEAEPEAELSAPTLTEGHVDELEHKRNDAGQLSPEDGAAPADPVADELKAKFSSEGGGTF